MEEEDNPMEQALSPADPHPIPTADDGVELPSAATHPPVLAVIDCNIISGKDEIAREQLLSNVGRYRSTGVAPLFVNWLRERADLRFEGLFRFVPDELLSAIKPLDPERPDFTDWRGIGATHLVVTQALAMGDNLQVDVKVYFPETGQTMLSKRFSGKGDNPRTFAHQVSDEITANARREAELMVKEAEMTADKIVQQAIERSTRFEGKIAELRTARREMQLRCKNTLDLFQRILEAEMEDERNTATVLTLPRKRREAGAS